MSELTPVHLVLTPYYASFASQIAQAFSGYERIALEFNGLDFEQRSELEGLLNVMQTSAFREAMAGDPNSAQDLETWAENEWQPATIRQLPHANFGSDIQPEIGFIGLSLDDPEFKATHEYEDLKAERTTRFSHGFPALATHMATLMASREAIRQQDIVNADQVYEMVLSDNRPLGVVTGLAHVGLQPLLEQRGIPVTTTELGVNAGQVPYEIQIHRQLHEGEGVEPALMERALLAELHRFYKSFGLVPGGLIITNVITNAKQTQLADFTDRVLVQQSLDSLSDGQVHDIVIKIEAVLENSDASPTDRRQSVGQLLEQIQQFDQ